MKKNLMLLIACWLVASCLLSQTTQADVRLNLLVPTVVQLRISKPVINLFLNWDNQFGKIYRPRIEVNNTYDLICTASDYVITAHLREPLPDPINTLLRLKVDPPDGGVSVGYIDLDVHPQTVVRDISNVINDKVLMLFEFSANEKAIPSSFSRVVTFTVRPRI